MNIIAALAVLLTALPVLGQSDQPSLLKGQVINLEDSFLEQLQARDSVLIADQLRYGFRLKNVPEGTGLALPDFSEGFMDKVEVVSSWKIDTVKVSGKKNGPKTYDLDISLIITSFDEGEYELMPLSVVRASGAGRADTLVFNSQVLDVRTMPVDTTTYQIHDLKGQIRYPLTFAELVPYILGVMLTAAIVALIWYLLARRKKASDENARKDPPHLVALRKLDRLRSNKYWAPEMQKAYYSGITDALREYIAARYDVDAMEMTTSEIFTDLKGSDIPKDLFDETKTLFETADFVKFAKALASQEENAAALPTAVRFVTTTYQSELEEDESASGNQEGVNVEEKKGGEA